MGRYAFQHDGATDRLELLTEYARRLTGVTDDFWERHILDARLYRILAEGAPVGWLTLAEGARLTALDIAPAHRSRASGLLDAAIDVLGISCAWAPTCDEGLLALCLDRARAVHPQAYLFDGATPHAVRPPEYPRALMRRIAPEEMAEVNRLSDDFFADDATEDSLRAGAQEVYALEDGGEALGWGIIVPVRSRPGYMACGMVTREDMRRRGVGRSVQLHLGDICRERGQRPLSGCWWKNEASRRTIESAGRYTTTTLVDITF